MLCHKSEHLDLYSRKPNNPSKAGRKRSNRHLDITNKSKKTKQSIQRSSTRVRGTSRQKIVKRNRNQTKRFVAMISMAKNIHKYKRTRHIKTAENFLDSFANLSIIDGHQSNGTHPLVYAAGGQGPNPNVFTHNAAMKAVDREKFEISMGEELDKMWAM